VIPNAVTVLIPLGHWAGYLFVPLVGHRGTLDCSSNAKIGSENRVERYRLDGRAGGLGRSQSVHGKARLEVQIMTCGTSSWNTLVSNMMTDYPFFSANLFTCGKAY
jgi:hypothetical protein